MRETGFTVINRLQNDYSMAIQRLHNDYMDLLKDPLPYAVAAPDPKNLLDFHFCLFGAPETPYEG